MTIGEFKNLSVEEVLRYLEHDIALAMVDLLLRPRPEFVDFPVGTVERVWIEDNDPGDEQPGTQQNRHAIIVLPPVTVYEPINHVTITGVVSI